MSEYDLNIFYVFKKDLTVVNGLLRLKGYPLSSLFPEEIIMEVFAIDEVFIADNLKEEI